MSTTKKKKKKINKKMKFQEVTRHFRGGLRVDIFSFLKILLISPYYNLPKNKYIPIELDIIILTCEVFGAKCVDKGIVHRQTATYPAGNLLCILQGIPCTPTLPPILRPSVLARCARCITHDSFLLRFLLLHSSHCHVFLPPRT